MNIFILDQDPAQCAIYHNDKHCSKMILETAQILCTGFEKGEAPYRLTHYNHPCSKWARKTLLNYRWLISLGHELAKEFEFRYGKRHKSHEVIKWCESNIGKVPFSGHRRTPFALAMPDYCKLEDAVESYRKLYQTEKLHLASWKNREKPAWFKVDL